MKFWIIGLVLWPSIAFGQTAASNGSDQVTKPQPIPGAVCPIDETQATAIRTCAQGSRPTLLRILVHADGFVSNLSVAQSSGNDLIDLVAVTCVSGWHYQPGTKNGMPVDTSINVRFDFKQSDPRCLQSSPPE